MIGSRDAFDVMFAAEIKREYKHLVDILYFSLLNGIREELRQHPLLQQCKRGYFYLFKPWGPGTALYLGLMRH